MDKLRRIIRSFGKYKMPHIDVLGNKDSTTQYTTLFYAIKNGDVNTDEEAAIFLFGPNAKKGEQKYKNFKTEFKKQLMHTLLFIDTSHEDFDAYQKMLYAINLEWMTIRALSRSGMSDVALALAKKILQTAIDYDYTDLVVQIIDLLKHSTAMAGDKKEYAKYQALHNHHISLWLWEQKAKEYSDFFRMEYVKNAQHKPHLSAVAKGYFEELKVALEKHDSTTLCINTYAVEIYIYSTVYDYKGMMDVAERALTYFKAKSFEVKTAITIFKHQKMIALMSLKRYAEAEEMLTETIALRTEGSFNWFVAQESLMFLLFKMHRFTEGYELYTRITQMKEFKELGKGMSREMWFLFNAYFHLLQRSGKMPLSVFDDNNKVFKLPKFLNSVPTFCQDKEGMNMAVQSVKLCFLILTKQEKALIEKESLKKYFDRHIKQDNPYYRFHQFGHLLLNVPESNYKRLLTEQNTVELRKTLESVPYDPVMSAYRGEVINLEEVWDWVLDTLD